MGDIMFLLRIVMTVSVCCLFLTPLYAENNTDVYPLTITAIEDTPDYQAQARQQRKLSYPDWFKESNFVLSEEFQQAKKNNKGIIFYFGQEECPYCDALINLTLQRTDIRRYIEKNFTVLAFDIWGDLIVTTRDNQRITERAFAEEKKMHLTPALIFYNPAGEEVLRLRGYYPPYTLRAALDFVSHQSNNKDEFKSYLSHKTIKDLTRASIEGRFFSRPPYHLDRSQIPSTQLLAVIFQQTACHACERLLYEFIPADETQRLLAQMEVVNLDIWQTIPLITPTGEHTTAKAWADKLNIGFTPTLLFFDKSGKNIGKIENISDLKNLHTTLRRFIVAP